MIARFPTLIAFLLVVTITLRAGESFADNYHVADAAELEIVLGRVGPGDTVTLRNGIWKDQYLQFWGRGEAARPITLRAETAGEVVLSGRSRLDISGQWLVVDGLRFTDGRLDKGQHIVRFTGKSGPASDSRLTNSEIIHYSPADKSVRYFWVSLFGKRNRVDHNRFQGHNHAGITVVVHRKNHGRDDHVIEYNHFLDRELGRGNGFETVRIGTGPNADSSSGTLIQYNLFERVNGEIETISLKSSNNIVRFNTFVQVQGTVTLRQGHGNKIIGNYFIGNSLDRTGGVRVSGQNHLIANNLFQELGGLQGGGIVLICGNNPKTLGAYHQVANVTIAHNTMVNISGSLINFNGSCGRNEQDQIAKDVHLVNNLLINEIGALYNGQEGSGWKWEGNLTCSYTSDIKKCTDIYWMRKGADGVWRPITDSPVIDSGVANNYINDEINSQLRVGPFGVGAHELSTFPVASGPMTGHQVGPLK